MGFMKKIENKNIEEAREKFISGGGLVQSDVIQIKNEPTIKKEEWTKLILRIRFDVLEEIDELVLKRMGLTRTAWILEAIQEKLRKNKIDN